MSYSLSLFPAVVIFQSYKEIQLQKSLQYFYLHTLVFLFCSGMGIITLNVKHSDKFCILSIKSRTQKLSAANPIPLLQVE